MLTRDDKPRCYETILNAVLKKFVGDMKDKHSTSLTKNEQGDLKKALTDHIARSIGHTPVNEPTHANFEGMELDDNPTLAVFVNWFKLQFPRVPVNAVLYDSRGKPIDPNKRAVVDLSQDKTQAKETKVVRKPVRRIVSSSSDDENDSDDMMHGAATSVKKQAPKSGPKSARGSDKVVDSMEQIQSMVREMVRKEMEAKSDPKSANEAGALQEAIVKQTIMDLQQTATIITGSSKAELQAHANHTNSFAQAALELKANEVGSKTIDLLNEHTKDGASRLMSAYDALGQSQALAASMEQKRRDEEAAAKIHEEQVRLALEAERQNTVAKAKKELEESLAAAKLKVLRDLEEETKQTIVQHRQEEMAKASALFAQMRLDLEKSSKPAPPPQVNISLKTRAPQLTKQAVDDALEKRILALRGELAQTAGGGALVPSVAKQTDGKKHKRSESEDESDVVTPAKVAKQTDGKKRKRSESDDESDGTTRSPFQSMLAGVDTFARFITGTNKRSK